MASKSDDPKRPACGHVIEAAEIRSQKGKTMMFREHVLPVERRKAPQ